MFSAKMFFSHLSVLVSLILVNSYPFFCPRLKNIFQWESFPAPFTLCRLPCLAIAPAIAANWEVNEQMENLCFSLWLWLSVKVNKSFLKVCLRTSFVWLTSYNADILNGHWFESWLLYFHSSFLLMHLSQRKDGAVPGSLPPMGETWVKVDLAQLGHCSHLGNHPTVKRSLSVCLSGTLPHKYIR